MKFSQFYYSFQPKKVCLTQNGTYLLILALKLLLLYILFWSYMVKWLVWLPPHNYCSLSCLLSSFKKWFFFFSDIKFCARSSFPKNCNECMSFPLLNVSHWQKPPDQNIVLLGPIIILVSVWKIDYSSSALSISIYTLG